MKIITVWVITVISLLVGCNEPRYNSKQIAFNKKENCTDIGAKEKTSTEIFSFVQRLLITQNIRISPDTRRSSSQTVSSVKENGDCQYRIVGRVFWESGSGYSAKTYGHLDFGATVSYDTKRNRWNVKHEDFSVF